MDAARLSQAFDAGAPDLAAMARVAVFGPRAGDDLSALPTAAVHVIQGFRPDHDAFATAGWQTSVVADGHYDAALVCIPRSRTLAHGLIAQAMAVTGGGPVLVDGRKDDGIDSLLKACRARAEVGGVVSKAHGKLFWMSGGDFGDWRAAAEPGRIEGGFVTRPGVFSADGPDRGSVLLAGALPAKLPKTVVDLGAGWGYLSRAILERQGVATLHLVEADHTALDCARVNITDPRAVFHWADATTFGPGASYDAVVTNPPFHSGRAAEPDLGRAFIQAAARLLKPSGRLWLVANRHLPYERTTRDCFAVVREIVGDPAFKILEAAKPARGRR